MSWPALLRDLCVSALLLSGSGLMLLSAYGLLKFPDVFCRGHAQTKATTLGLIAMLAGLWIELGGQGSWPLLFAMLTQALTIPVAGHMIALLAFQKKVPRYRQRKVSYPKGYAGGDLEA